MQNLKEVIENLKAEQKKQGIAPAGFSIRERVEGRLEELENEVEQLRYESACFTIRSKENESSDCQMLSWEEKKNLLLLYFDDILVTVQWLVHIYATLKGTDIDEEKSFRMPVGEEEGAIVTISFDEERVISAIGAETGHNKVRDGFCPLLMEAKKNFPDIAGAMRSCFDALWEDGLGENSGIVSGKTLTEEMLKNDNGSLNDGYSHWIQTNAGWWFRFADGSYPKAAGATNSGSGNSSAAQSYEWVQIDGNWWSFDSNGYLGTGWILDQIYGNWFYVDSNTGMKTGWVQINGKWYYFNPVSDGTKGTMFANRMTPDGWFVREDGSWDEKR